MTKKRIGICGAVAGIVVAVIMWCLHEDQQEQPYVWGGFAEERKEQIVPVQANGQTYEVRSIRGASNAIVSLWKDGKQVGKDIVVNSTNGTELARQALRGGDK